MHMNINHFGMVNTAESGLERGYFFFFVLFGGD